MKHLLTALLAFALAVIMPSDYAAALENDEVIVLEYPPLTTQYRDDYGHAFALLSEYAEQHFKLTPKPEFLPPARAVHELTSGQWCLSFYPAKPLLEDARFLSLADEEVAIGLYRRIDDMTPDSWQDLSELAGYRVAVMRNRQVGPFQQQLIDAQLRLVEVNSVAQGLRMLLRGRVDYAMGDSTSLQTYGFSDQQQREIALAQTSLLTARVGVFYNPKCEQQLFVTPPSAAN
ncbi:transporter substrate-binding domain-containing protein [Aliagarivorans marinus]|uniref:transporter substrate-binding domain-containing protein n=1 Tax=Aliagarivorans marinus TaxID=561965 RepID=UPI0004282554|nr:transporter substrate-binding domain-containing protein [Aliagarivorans marinus]